MRISIPSSAAGADRTHASPEAQAADILRNFDAQGLSSSGIVAWMERNPPSKEVAALLFRALADRFEAERDAGSGRWAFCKAMEMEARMALDGNPPAPAGNGSAEHGSLSRTEEDPAAGLSDSWLDDLLRHHGARRSADALRAFLRGLEACDSREDASVLTELETAAGLVLSGGFAAAEPNLHGSCRQGLRNFLRRWFTGSPGPDNLNLVVVDAVAASGTGRGGSGAPAALEALLDHRPKSIPEDFQASETSMLWVAGNKAVLITREDSWSKPAAPAILSLGALCANYSFPEGIAAAGPSGDWRAAPGCDAASVRDRECIVIEHLPLFAHAMRYLVDKPAFTDPKGFLGDAGLLVSHAGEYRRTDDNRNDTWTPLVTAHCQTNAYVNDFLHFLTRLYSPPYRLPGTRGVLGDMRGSELDRVVSQLDEKGYFKFDTLVPEDIRKGLVLHAREDECLIYGEGVQAGLRGRYDGRNPKGSKYQLDADISLKTPEFQALLADHSILSVTQGYLASRVTMETCAMWWLPLFGSSPSFAAAQQFHFDMDRWKWLNWFVYLTDVTTGTAPHTIIQRSHLRGSKPNSILQRGYVRVSDEELGLHYPAEDFLELTGPAGTIMAVDTRVWHKAKFPTTGERLILEIVCCTSMFGNDSLKRGPKLPGKPIPELARLVESFPRMYAQYL
jgi:hypothetical protein